jgi:deoxyribose-phosphate aldolase
MAEAALPQDDRDLARLALSLLDLTDLSDNCSEAHVQTLCADAMAGPVPAAAVCVWPQYVSLARRLTGRSGVKVATVANFPGGGSNTNRIVDEVREALNDGADEIDLVLPWRSLVAGDEELAREMVEAVRGVIDPPCLLKVILETGALPDHAMVARAARIAITAGADFIKTSTGKTAVSATPQAVETMIGMIRASGRPVGLKPSGGLRTLDDARVYLGLVARELGPDWLKPARFRFGASGLRKALLAVVEGQEPEGQGSAGETPVRQIPVGGSGSY